MTENNTLENRNKQSSKPLGYEAEGMKYVFVQLIFTQCFSSTYFRISILVPFSLGFSEFFQVLTAFNGRAGCQASRSGREHEEQGREGA
jgi:hypothetical protein